MRARFHFHHPSWAVMAGVALVIASAFTIYQPALHGAWQWDDTADVRDNVLLRSARGLVAIWFHPAALADYYPLKYTVQWLQWHAWGDHTFGYHVTNVALHALSGVLFWRVLRQLNVGCAWLGALLFVAHPLNVESVAWIAELKNTLSLPPLLLATSALLRYAEDGTRRHYLSALLWFTVSLLCKATAVLFPVFACVLLWWQHGRVSVRDWVSLAPFFAVSLACSALTLVNQHRAIGVLPVEIGGMISRPLLCLASIGFYVRACVAPNPMPLHPQWPLAQPPLDDLLAFAAVAAACVWGWRCRATWGRHLLLGIAWFLLLILPFAGLVDGSYMHFAWVMDHLAYAALPGLLALFAAGVGVLQSAGWLPTARLALASALAAVALVFATESRAYAAAYDSNDTLWHYALRKNPDAWFAHFCLGVGYGHARRLNEAKAEYAAALALKPTYPPALDNLAVLLAENGEYRAAIAHLRTAATLAPSAPALENDLGIALSHAGEHAEAIQHLRHALQLQPDYAEARSNLGSALLRAGRPAEAEAEYRAALALAPDTFGLHYNLGLAQQACGHWQDAADNLKQALAQDPQSPAIQHDLASCLAHLAESGDASNRTDPHQSDPNRIAPTQPAPVQN